MEVIAVTIIVFTAGAGHGTYAPARLLFPFTMLSTLLHGTIKDAYALLALLQFPIYGVILAMAVKSNRTKLTASLLIAIHTIAVFMTFVFLNPSFPN